jgi:SAM-dependent methyltransferase
MPAPPRSGHDQALEAAFDHQAALFERAPVQTDQAALERLVRFARFPAGSHVLDAGCGPGLVALTLLESGLRVTGVDLSPEMIRRAVARCASHGAKARFVQGSLLDDRCELGTRLDGAISRYVLHHVVDHGRILDAQIARVKPGGVVVLSDHTTDPSAERARWHQGIECARDRTHTWNLTLGEMVDLCASRGLVEIEAREERFTLDFDEWFDRGSSVEAKEVVRQRILDGPGARGFMPRPRDDGGIDLLCWRGMVRGSTVGDGDDNDLDPRD